MIVKIKEEWSGGKRIAEFTCSSVNAIAKLPTSMNGDVGAGSSCICTENSTLYILGADDVWHAI